MKERIIRDLFFTWFVHRIYKSGIFLYKQSVDEVAPLSRDNRYLVAVFDFGDFADLQIRIAADDLARIGKTFLIGGGEKKISAIRGTLKTGLVTHLITDDRTAQALVGLIWLISCLRPAALKNL